MSLKHRDIHRHEGEFLCTHCGKSWDINDTDPPACVEDEQTFSMERFTKRPVEYRYQTNVAWFVTEVLVGPNAPATVIYASSRNEAADYVRRVMGPYEGIEISRLKALDDCATGRAPYFEINPKHLTRAAKAQRCVVVNLHKFKDMIP